MSECDGAGDVDDRGGEEDTRCSSSSEEVSSPSPPLSRRASDSGNEADLEQDIRHRKSSDEVAGGLDGVEAAAAAVPASASARAQSAGPAMASRPTTAKRPEIQTQPLTGQAVYQDTEVQQFFADLVRKQTSNKKATPSSADDGCHIKTVRFDPITSLIQSIMNHFSPGLLDTFYPRSLLSV